ncbi:AAA family ATPase [Candidatus Nanosalina sp. VS9-1]|uniref:AAA family ATPase n=1 Tax=Candidatus Nanosalina sp. VS9-1 TaxID=3388566 RepID=UPI0039DF6C58
MAEVYGVTGMPLSGKTTVADYMQDHGFAVLDMGDVVRIEMEKRNIATEDTGQWVNDMRAQHGMDAIARISIPYLKEMAEEKERIVITGMRGWSEKKRFEKETGHDIEVVAVWTSRETRRERREDRKREEDVKGDGFDERDLREVENGVGKLMALSDHMIKNEDISEEQLEHKVEKLIES